MLRLGMLVLGVTDMGRAITFWRAALGYEVREGSAASPWAELGPPGEGRSALALQHSDEPARDHPRVHLDLYADDSAEQHRERRRLVSLGAAEVDWDSYPEDPDFVVLADPDGNRFCIVDASHG